MTIEDLFRLTSDSLQDAGYVHGQREAEIIISHFLDADSRSIFSFFEKEADPVLVEFTQEALRKRLQGSPISYIIGEQQFMSWKLLTDSRALIPRPETEYLVEELISEIRGYKLETGDFLEIGTGAGPIALTLKKYFSSSKSTASDISEDALDLASENAKRLKVDVEF